MRRSPCLSRCLSSARAAALAILLAAVAVPAVLAGTRAPTPSPTDVTRLPLGDGHVSSTPRRGDVEACRQAPGRPNGADHAGPWIHGSTFDLKEKAVVDGRVHWNGSVRFAVHGSRLGVTGNGVPRATPTGTFPISPVDDAYAYDRNPNSIRRQSISLSLPAHPKLGARPSCLPMGMIGIAVDGVAIFNALDDSHRDAVAHETQDLCEGHPQRRGIYHYSATLEYPYTLGCFRGTPVRSPLAGPGVP